MNSVRTAGAWLRRAFGWSNSRRSWYERLGFLALVVSAVGAEWLSRGWGLEARLLLVALWLVLLAVLLRRGIIKLLGPVFFYELLRGSRRNVHAGRTVTALLLFVALGYVHLAYREFERSRAEETLQDQAEVASTFFTVFFGIEMFVAALVTPVMVAGAIADEKERRTLEFILATDLRSREIVLGKLAARLSVMGFLLLAGLPILSLLQFQGGIDPDMLLCALAALVVTLVSVAALSLWMSTMLRRVRDAIVLTYLVMFGYALLSGLFCVALDSDFANAAVNILNHRVEGRDVIFGVGAGNPAIAAVRISDQASAGTGGVMDVIPDLLLEYSIFHGLVSLTALVWAVVRLRPVGLAQGPGETKRVRRGRRLPALGRFPMIWKELFAEPGMRLHLLLWIIVALIVLASFVPPVTITAEYFQGLTDPAHIYRDDRLMYDPWEHYGREMNVWVRVMGGVLGTLMLLMVAARAAGAVTGERARKTLDELLTTPLTNAEIINAKWLGAVCGTRRLWLWMGAVLFIGLCSTGLHVLGAILYVAAWFCFAGFLASVGLWFSTVARNTHRATAATLFIALLALGGHWIVTGLLCYLPLNLAFGNSDTRDLVEWMIPIQAGLTPPAVLAMTPFQHFTEFHDGPDRLTRFVACAFLGAVVFLVAGQVIRRMVIVIFGQVMGRTRFRRSERWHPLPKLPIVGEPALPDGEISAAGPVSP